MLVDEHPGMSGSGNVSSGQSPVDSLDEIGHCLRDDNDRVCKVTFRFHCTCGIRGGKPETTSSIYASTGSCPSWIVAKGRFSFLPRGPLKPEGICPNLQKPGSESCAFAIQDRSQPADICGRGPLQLELLEL